MKKQTCAAVAGAAVAVSVFFLLMPDTVGDAVTRALTVCFKSVIPSVFPYSVMSSLFVAVGGADIVDRLTSPVFSRVFGTGHGASALLLGLIFGFPLGALVVGAQHRAGTVSTSEASRLLSFVCCASPTFPVFAVGRIFFGSTELGLVIWATQAAASILLGIVVMHTCGTDTHDAPSAPTTLPDKTLLATVTASVTDASRVMLNVCGSVTFFSLCAAVASDALSAVSPSPYLRAAVGSIFEFSTASSTASSLMRDGMISYASAAAFAGFAVGFSGLSVIFQNASVAGGVPLLPHICGKLAVGAVTALSAYIYANGAPLTTVQTALCVSAAVALTVFSVIFIKSNKNSRRGLKKGA